MEGLHQVGETYQLDTHEMQEKNLWDSNNVWEKFKEGISVGGVFFFLGNLVGISPMFH